MIHHSLPNTDIDRTHAGFSATDLPLPSISMNAAEIILTTRYPAEGYALNTVSEMIVRIINGSTRFWCEGEEIQLPTGSTVLVETNKKYYWLPEESVTLHTVSSPPWTPEQHRNV